MGEGLVVDAGVINHGRAQRAETIKGVRTNIAGPSRRRTASTGRRGRPRGRFINARIGAWLAKAARGSVNRAARQPNRHWT